MHERAFTLSAVLHKHTARRGYPPRPYLGLPCG